MLKHIVIAVTMFGILGGLLCSDAEAVGKGYVELQIYSNVNGVGVADYRAEDVWPSFKMYWQPAQATAYVRWNFVSPDNKDHLATAAIRLGALSDQEWYYHDSREEIVGLSLK